MSNITELHKKIYNCYLKNLRKGQPYKERRNFSDLNPNIAAALSKIGNFLTRYPHINCEEYFEAFNVLHPDDKFPPITFFYSRAAIKNYSLYKKHLENRNPENQFQEIKDSMRFIGMYCLKNNIPLIGYLYHKNGYTYSWLNHYREHKINPYCLFELGDVFSVLNGVPKDELYLFSSSLQQNLVAFRDRYDKSKKTKDFTKEVTKKVKEFVEKQLTTTNKLIN
jgi:hypothetical protein